VHAGQLAAHCTGPIDSSGGCRESYSSYCRCRRSRATSIPTCRATSSNTTRRWTQTRVRSDCRGALPDREESGPDEFSLQIPNTTPALYVALGDADVVRELFSANMEIEVVNDPPAWRFALPRRRVYCALSQRR